MTITDGFNAPWEPCLERDGVDDIAVIRDADGHALLHSQSFRLPVDADPVPPTLAAMRPIQAAPQLLAACRLLVERWSSGNLAEAARACRDAIAAVEGGSL